MAWAPAIIDYFKDVNILAFTGLWEHWQAENGEIIESCTIITTEANQTLGKIHDRMPAVIAPENYESWLNLGAATKTLLSLLKPFSDEKMVAYPVGNEVNNPKNDNPDCLAELKKK